MTDRFKGSDAALLALAWIAMVAVANPIGDFPQNDDWVYARAVRSILQHGRFELLDMTSANVGPQAYWGALFARMFGFGYTSLRFSTLLVGMCGVVALYALALEVWQDRRIALVLSAAILVNPVFFALANTFMTDVPFLVSMLVSMLAIAAGQRRRSGALVVTGLAIALFTVFLRQFAIVVLVGFAVAHLVQHGRRPKTILVALAPLCAGLLCHYLFNRWLIESGRKPLLPSQDNILLSFSAGSLWKMRYAFFTSLSYLGLFLIPLAILCFPRARSLRGNRTLPIALVVCAVAVACLHLYAGSLVPVGGNTLTAEGIGPKLINETAAGTSVSESTFLVSSSWKIMTLLAIGSSACLLVAIGIAVRRILVVGRQNDGQTRAIGFVHGSFLAGIAASYLAILVLVALRYPVFDRYLLPLVVVAGLALPMLGGTDAPGERRARGRWAVASAFIAGVAIFTVIGTHDHLRWSDARWQALEALMKAGIPPEKIDGGYEFNGTFLYDAKYRSSKGKSTWWVADDEYLISSEPVKNYAVIDRIVVDRWWRGVGSDVLVLRRDPVPTGS